MSKARKIAIIATVLLVILFTLAYMNRSWIERQFLRATGSTIENGVSSSDDQQKESIEVLAQDLTVPWGVAFLPEGDVIVTERSGTLRRIKDGKIHKIEGVRHVGEGGLLGVAVHPEFDKTHQIYLYLTTQSGGSVINRVEQYRYDNAVLSERTVILDNIPGSTNHDGGRLAFGPDKKLYITTGDAGNESASQDKNSLAGKILRLNDDGSIPADNPYANAVYSYGHRNPQGIAWDDRGQLWSTEHGRSGVKSGFDELNLIKKGANYGWPVIEGDKTQSGMENPVVHSGASETWAPASLAYSNGSLFFGGLRGESLYEAKLDDKNQVSLKAHFRNNYGRIRTVATGPNHSLFMTTSNTDGRGDAKPNDDKLIRIDSKVFGR